VHAPRHCIISHNGCRPWFLLVQRIGPKNYAIRLTLEEFQAAASASAGSMIDTRVERSYALPAMRFLFTSCPDPGNKLPNSLAFAPFNHLAQQTR